MKIFLGDTRGKTVDFLKSQNWGRIFATDRRIGPLYPFERWGFDNGAFDAWKHAKPFPEHTFLKRLDSALEMNGDPTVAVVPDLVARGLESLEFSVRWLDRLPRNWPWYLAVQDGMSHSDVIEVAHLFSGIFLGGTDKFKLGAYGWCKVAHSCQKPFHYGRAGTLTKLRHAWNVGADSIDSNFPLWTKKRLAMLRDECAALESGEVQTIPGIHAFPCR